MIGFEIEEKGRKLTQEMYTKNFLTNRITLLGEATNSNVSKYITEKTLFICDCEGAELDILDTNKVPEFLKVETAIIELHDFIHPGIKEALLERFKNTHNIQIIRFALANPNDFPFFSEVKNKKDLYEIRRERGWQEQEWMILEKK